MSRSELGETESKKVPPVSFLREICHAAYMDPKGPLSEAFSRHTYYKVNIYFTWLFLHTEITPNQITLLSLLLGLTGCAFLTQLGWYPMLGVALFQFSFMFDVVDGDVARYRRICSLSGAFFDRLATAILEPLIYFSLAYGTYSKIGTLSVLLLGFSAAISILLIKTVLAYLHVAVLEPIMHKKHAEMIARPENFQKDTLLTEYFDYRPSSPFLRISEFLLGHGLSLSLYSVVLLDSILNLTFTFMSITLNFSYLFLIVTGICLPMVWIGAAVYIIKKKAPERLFCSVFPK